MSVGDSLILAASIIFVVFVYFVYKFFTQPLAEFLNDSVKTLLWIWLPFFALGHLLKEFREKKMK